VLLDYGYRESVRREHLLRSDNWRAIAWASERRVEETIGEFFAAMRLFARQGAAEMCSSWFFGLIVAPDW
jgi:hypothetical protein